VNLLIALLIIIALVAVSTGICAILNIAWITIRERQIIKVLKKKGYIE